MKLQRQPIHAMLLGLLALAMTGAVCTSATAMQDGAKPTKTVQKTPPPESTPEAKPEGEHLPEADAIIERHIEALGGEKAMKEHKYRTFTGEMNIPSQGISGSIVIHQAEPNFFHLALESAAIGEAQQGSDGEHAWAMDTMTGARLLDGAEKEAAMKDSDFYSELNFRKHYPKRETVSKEEFDGAMCYKVRLTSPSGKVSENYYSLDTGLLMGMKGQLDSPQGELSTLAHVKDYKAVDGVKYPMTTQLDFTDFNISQTITFKKISHEEFSKDEFALPKQIKALVDEKAKKASEPAKDDEPSEPMHEE